MIDIRNTTEKISLEDTKALVENADLQISLALSRIDGIIKSWTDNLIDSIQSLQKLKFELGQIQGFTALLNDYLVPADVGRHYHEYADKVKEAENFAKSKENQFIKLFKEVKRYEF